MALGVKFLKITAHWFFNTYNVLGYVSQKNKKEILIHI